MAASGCTGDNSSGGEIDDSSGQKCPDVSEITKRNGIRIACECDGKSSNCVPDICEKMTKCVRMNGISKISKQSLTHLMLRSRGEKFNVKNEVHKKRKKSQRFDRQESSDSIKWNSLVSPVVVFEDEKFKMAAEWRRLTRQHSLGNLSCNEASQQSIISDATTVSEPCTPDTPDTSRSSTPLPNQSCSTASIGGNRTSSIGNSEVLQDTGDSVMCRWINCNVNMPCSSDMIEHIRGMHVDNQTDKETFVCLWQGCKVFNKPSCSLNWLERHVLTHSGNKPFKCIVDGCRMRFTSHSGLERHVNSHFNSQPPNPRTPKNKEDTPTKLLKKRKFRYRRRNWPIKTEDFFDSGIMECIRHRLVTFNNKTKLDLSGTGSSVTFHSSVIARRIEDTGKVKVLLHWIPEHVLPDVWVPESQAHHHHKRSIPLASLPQDAIAELQPALCKPQSPHRKNRRK